MANNVVTLTYRADLKQLQKQLATFSDIQAAEARKLVNDLNRSLRAAEKANEEMGGGGKRAAKGLRQTTAAASNLQAQLFDIGTGLQGGQNPLTILAQQGPQIAQVFTGGAKATAVLKAAMTGLVAVVGPVATVIGAGALAWKLYNAESDRAEHLTQMQGDAYTRLTPLIDMTEAATLRLQVATGELTKTQAEQIESSTRALEAFRDATKETRTQLAELRKEQGSVGTQLVDFGEKVLDVVDIAGVNTAIFKRLTTSSADLQDQITVLAGAEEHAITVLRRGSDATREAIDLEDKASRGRKTLTTQTREATAAHREFVAAWRESLAIMDEDTRLTLERVGAIDQLRTMAAEATQARVEGIDKVTAAEQKQLASALALFQLAVKNAEAGEAGDAARLEAIEAFETAQTEIRAAAIAERSAIESEAADAARRDAEVTARAISTAYGTAASQIAGATATAAQVIADGFADSNREAAAGAIAVAKAAGITQVAIDTALAVSNISANWAAAPPVVAALSAGAIALGAAQAGVIAAQGVTFHAGGIAGGTTMHSDEVPATLLRGEPVLTRQAGDMLGEQGVNDLNAGRMPIQTIVIEQRYGQGAYGAVTYDAVRNPTTPMYRALKGRTKAGSNI